MAHVITTIVNPSDQMQEHPLYWNSPPFSQRTDQLSLSAGAAGTWVVPAGGWDSVIITFTAGRLYSSGGSGETAAAPVATVTDGSGSAEILNGQVRRIQSAQVISFFNATACTISFELFANGRRDP